MTAQEAILYAVVAAVGIPSACRNPTAAALVLSWIASKLIYLVTGNGLAVEFYLFPDLFTIAVIMAKPERCNFRPYRGAIHQIECLLLERSPADRIVLLAFPLMWALYIVPLEPFWIWHGLWLLSIVQFLAAGVEAFANHRREYAARRLPVRPGDLLVAHGGGGSG